MRALWKRLRSEQSGLSFTEVMVAMLLTLVLFAMVGGMFVQVAKLTTAAGQTRDSNGNASNIANEVNSVVRVATNLAKLNSTVPDTAVVDGTRSSLTVYSLVDTSATAPAPTKVTITLDAAGKVTETRCTGSLSGNYFTFGSCTATSTRVLGIGVLAPTGVTDQLFTYRDVNDAPIVIGTASLTAAQRALVSSITVTVRTQPANSTTRPVIVSNTVVLRNIGLDTGT